ncbi:enoyl-CoA hydratase-related protein [Haliangium ochraceum]|uniref:Enoyl-CoA hydratase/isomerase n=1 Tax=Haliangium ochraceum (strain DSM 14365 / JCM 11303 / SMP-2) TaxID=502025 RepID=D0LX53_HALO1|nr:enoyl-CoA hydratase-related protein [Haliangium ochraceum]ACY16095.1 Enoyl-CoA hydratase/isomerase [Haliangium ochraceum DSM 14365]
MADANADHILVERRDAGVVWVTLNRPAARNALSLAVNRDLRALAGELGRDPEVRAVVLTGAGDKAFCAGADLKERKGVSAADTPPYIDAISGAIDAWARLPRPTIALMNGHAFGGGLELALACDFRIAAASAQMALTEVRLGIMPGAGGSQRLPRLIGVARAKELILLGRRVTAARAAEIGLVTQVAPAEELGTAAEALLTDLAACAPRSVEMAKEAIDRGVEVGIDEGLRIERACYEVTLFTEDRDEGLRAFAEGRAPNYRGR